MTYTTGGGGIVTPYRYIFKDSTLGRRELAFPLTDSKYVECLGIKKYRSAEIKTCKFFRHDYLEMTQERFL